MCKETILVEGFFGYLLNRLHEMLLKYLFQLESQQIQKIQYIVLQKLEDFIGILKDETIDYGHLTMKLINGCLEMLNIHHIQNDIEI
jgi:hypothetical protein